MLPEGGTLGDAFQSYRRQTGKQHPEDKSHVTAPTELLYLWSWYWELAQGRPIGPEGVQLPVPSSEIAAWAGLAGVRLADWELMAVRALDAAYLRVSTEKGI